MVVGIMKVKMRGVWIHSLKEKRMVIKSMVSKLRNRFNVSISEVEDQDIHQLMAIGISCITTDSAHANSTLDRVLNYIDSNFEPEIVDYEIEIIRA
jgi:uncharacterized protein